MRQPEIVERRPAEMKEFYADDWLFVGVIPLKAGEAAEQHVHEYDHPSVVATGTIRVWVDGEDKGLFVAPTYVTIRAGQQHRFLAVTDALILCCHNLRGEGYPALLEA